MTFQWFTVWITGQNSISSHVPDTIFPSSLRHIASSLPISSNRKYGACPGFRRQHERGLRKRRGPQKRPVARRLWAAGWRSSLLACSSSQLRRRRTCVQLTSCFDLPCGNGVPDSSLVGASSPPQLVKSMTRQSLVATIPLLLMAHILQR